MTNACATYGVTMILLPAGALGQASGKAGRMAAATQDASFAGSMIKTYRLLSGVH